MKIIGLDEVQSVVDHEAAFEAVRSSMLILAGGDVNAPDEFAMHLAAGGELHVKGAHLKGSPWIAMKVASGGFPDAPNAGCTMLLEAATGAPAVILDDDGWLTEMRTAAAGAVATDTLAIEGPLRVAVLGTGIQARFQLGALASRRPISETVVWGRTPERASKFAAEIGAQVASTAAEAASDVDVIITCTSSTSPILHSVSPGTHITAMGSDTIGKRELGSEILDNASVIAADDVTSCARVGELQHVPNCLDVAVNLCDVVAGTAAGRQTTNDITIADLCGIGTYDAAIAGLVADHLL